MLVYLLAPNLRLLKESWLLIEPCHRLGNANVHVTCVMQVRGVIHIRITLFIAYNPDHMLLSMLSECIVMKLCIR